MSSLNEYVDSFDEDTLPLDVPADGDGAAAAAGDDDAAAPLVKHGCTNDVRQLWADSRADVPEDLEGALRRAGLLAGAAWPAQKRPKRKLALAADEQKQDPKKKKRHVNRANQKLTNTHLSADSELGRLLKSGLPSGDS